MTTPLAVSRFRVQNFKAIRDSGIVRFSPLTAFIGNNGVGKSSLVEGLETLKHIARDGLDEAMQRWRGFDFIRNKAVTRQLRYTKEGKAWQTSPTFFGIAGTAWTGFGESRASRPYRAYSQITMGEANNEVFFLREMLSQKRETGKRTVSRHTDGTVFDGVEDVEGHFIGLSPNESVFYAEPSLALWQFVRIQPENMIAPRPVRQVAGYLPLATDGSNIAEFLIDIRYRDADAFDGIIEAMQTVLPYAVDIQPVVTSEIGRNAYIRLQEQNITEPLPAWLLSTGTLRVVALLALLRHPEPPPLIVIEEIENGLDPRTIHLLVEEMRYAVENGTTQIILTTHSPYLLDLLTLSQIVVVERGESGEPQFHRPSDEESLQKWSDQFTPGQLYTMGRLGKGNKY